MSQTVMDATKSHTPKKDISKYKKDFLLKLLKDMHLIRRFEEKSAEMYGLQKIGGFCHLYIGQEAMSSGSIAALDLKKDYVLTSYRDHGHALSCGMSARAAMAELFGKATGCAKGKGGSMHFFDVKNHMYGGNGIVGSQIPIASGIAFKIRYLEEHGVVLCFFGDGAIHQGAFHESCNLAKIWKLPIIFICENNVYGMGTDFKRISGVHDFSVKADSYGFPGKQVNGMDVLEVYEDVSTAVELARKEGMPSFLEMKSYRYKGHSMSDPAKYRAKDEVEKYRTRDPIINLKHLMIENNLLTEDEFRAIDKETNEIVDDAVRFADESPEPDIKELWTDVLSE